MENKTLSYIGATAHNNYSITFIPYFQMKNGQIYTWSQIPSSIPNLNLSFNTSINLNEN